MADADTTTPQQTVEPPLLSPAAHAVLDYAVAGAYLLVGVALLSRQRRAGVLALANGAMICAVSMMTNYPVGVWPRVSFKTHRTLDLVQASLAGAGPYVLGFELISVVLLVGIIGALSLGKAERRLPWK